MVDPHVYTLCHACSQHERQALKSLSGECEWFRKEREKDLVLNWMRGFCCKFLSINFPHRDCSQTRPAIISYTSGLALPLSLSAELQD